MGNGQGMADPYHITAIRLRARMEEIGISQEMLADGVGCSQGAISKILTGSSHNSRFLPRIAQNLAINLNWLLGVTDEKIDMFDVEGDDLTEDHIAAMKAGIIKNRLLHPEQLEPPIVASSRIPFRGFEPEADPDIVQVQHIDFAFGMGGQFMEEPGRAKTMAFSRRWLRNFTDAPPEAIYWAEAIGDSMAPTISSNDSVLVDTTQKSPRAGDMIWACAWGDVGMIKRLRPRPDGTISILSDNHLVPPEIAADGELHVLGRVVAKVGKL